MDFHDTPEEAAFRAEARAWIDENRPADWQTSTRTEPDMIKAAKAWQARKADAGWAVLHWPKEFGGRDASPMERAIWNQEEDDLSLLSGIFIIGLGMAGATIMAHGDDAQKQRYLQPMARGDEVWCQLFSEPASGSDLAGLRTRAERDGDEWLVNGQKIWTSFGHFADFGILVARTDPDVPKHEGLTYFILDMKSPGIEARPIKQITGNSEFNEVYFTDLRIPDSCRLGSVGEGWKVAMTTLMNERLAVGLAFPTGFDEMFEFVRGLELEDGSAIKNKAVRDRLADWYIKSAGLKYTGLRTVSALSRGGTPGPEASIGKLVLGGNRQDMASLMLDLQDMAGILTESGEAAGGGEYQWVFLRAAGNRIEGGTDEILRNIIAERVLGLPADVRVDKDVPFKDIPTGR